jgi:hypothetical protein
MGTSPTPTGMNPAQLPLFYGAPRHRSSPLPEPSVKFLLESLVLGCPAQKVLSLLPLFEDPLRDTPSRSPKVQSSPHTLSQPSFAQLPLQGWSGQMRKISPPTGIRFPNRPARSQSLHQLRYPVHEPNLLPFITLGAGNELSLRT